MELNPFDLPALPFLVLYIVVCTVILFFIRISRRYVVPGRDNLIPLTPFELAYLAGSGPRTADTILVGLLEAGALRQSADRKTLYTDSSSFDPSWLPTYVEIPNGPARRAGLNVKIRHSLKPMLNDLVSRGLISNVVEHALLVVINLILISAGVLLGVVRIMLSTERGYETGYLNVLVFSLLIIGLALLSNGPYRTSAGTRALNRAKQENSRAVRAPVGDEVMLAFALVGATALAGRSYRSFFLPTKDYFGSSSGCGGGGCGG